MPARYPDAVAFYREQVVPRLVALTCGARGLDGLRSRTAVGLRGRVVELGFGSGFNVPHYPDDVERILAVEPSATAFRMAGGRIGASTVPVEQVGLDGRTLPLDDASCDAALCTFALCTIPDVEVALAELRRVLRPGARFHFLEHGLAPDARVAAFQRRMEPLQRRVADGCHLTRDPVALAGGAGFVVEELDQHYGVGPKAWVYLTRAVAVRA
jgi:SAM-dependent methyltransferase